MPVYKYKCLNPTTQEIRLLQLLPGTFSQAIRISISHDPLVMSDVYPKPKISKDELQKTLPSDWTVWETLEGRFIFNHAQEDGGDVTSWTHPNPQFDHNQYNLAENGSTSASQARYVALSYTWGSIESPETIVIEPSGSSTQQETKTALPSTMQIGQNLAEALRHLRLPDQSRTLWVDAICINQNDNAERSEQVKRMGNIYKFASSVLVWLGPGTHNSQLAVSTLSYLGNQIEFTLDRFYLPSPHCKEDNWHLGQTKLTYNEATWQAIHDLLGRSWFQRLWVFQEIQLANRNAVFQCGSESMLWYHFRRAVLRLGNNLSYPSVEMQKQIMAIASLCESRVKTTFPRLIGTATTLKCSEPRDKVYAILGLTTPKIASCIKPQYSLPVGEVYKDAFLAHTKLSLRLDLLVRSSLKDRYLQMPSWVPNFFTENVVGLTYAVGTRAGGMSSAQIKYCPPDTLEVTGVYFDTIHAVGKEVVQTWEDIFQVARDIGKERLLAECYPTGEKMLDALAWAVSSALLQDRFPAVSTYFTAEKWKDIILASVSDCRSIKGVGAYSRYPAMMLSAIKGKRIFFTVKGYIGYAPEEVKPGDQVCVFLGYNVPVLLRQHTLQNLHVIGQCYVYGLMDGEALLGALPHPWKGVVNPSINNSDVRFRNSSTGSVCQDDPRLGDFPAEWERVQLENELGDGFVSVNFRNKFTGELINSDPRLLPAALLFRGVGLKTFRLV